MNGLRYVRALEERLDKMEQLLRHVRQISFLYLNRLTYPIAKVRPELDLEHPATSTNSPESVHSAPTPPSTSYPVNTPATDLPYPTPQTLPDTAAFQALPPNVSSVSSEEEDLSHISLSEHLSRLAVETIEDRFFGKSRYV